MKGLPFVLLFTAMTFFAWGSYGPTLHHGAVALEHDSMRAFVGVGLAYFLIAVIIPFAYLQKWGEVGNWTVGGSVLSFVAGAVGAIGALGIILALGYGGETVYVMPLVFGFAPVVNTLVSAAISRTFGQISPIFIAGIVATALGAAGVLFFKPPPSARAAAEVAAASEEVGTDSPEAAEVDSSDSIDSDAEGEQAAAPEKREANWTGIIASIVIAAGCWGSYGPMLHIGQARMNGSRLRPFACVGLAYFFIAVAAPMALIYARTSDGGAWTTAGMTWSFVAGVAGAIGALGVILAFNAGGKPFYVMPLIFGFAPVINTFISLTEAQTWEFVKLPFWGSLAVVIAGAVTVLTNAPRPGKHGKKPVSESRGPLPSTDPPGTKSGETDNASGKDNPLLR